MPPPPSAAPYRCLDSSRDADDATGSPLIDPGSVLAIERDAHAPYARVLLGGGHTIWVECPDAAAWDEIVSRLRPAE